MNTFIKILILSCVICITNQPFAQNTKAPDRPRIVVTSDGEIDDQCSMIRFMLYTNECDVEAIVSSSSQYHAHDQNWAGDDWIEPDLAAYTKIYPNLVKHDSRYPTPEYLKKRIALGNVKTEGDMEKPTAGSDLIAKVLLDKTDDRPVWLQAWGGMNTIARALKTIEEKHPERMAEVAKKCRFFLIWEQDETYQEYIRPVWGKYEIPTIVSDQFEAIAYRWKMAQPEEMHPYFQGAWMKENILENHGPLCSIYAAHENGDFRSEGDSPAFLHTIVTGLRNMESPEWGGWGGRYVRVRENTWLDPVPVSGFIYPKGRWYGNTGWGRNSLRPGSTSTPEQRKEYFKPMWRWTEALQNDFAARADWCVKSYKEANHPPVVVLGHGVDLKAKPGETVNLSAKGSSDPDGDKLFYRWWQYEEADSYTGTVDFQNSNEENASFTVPRDADHTKTIHIICEVKDSGSPPITRYQRVVVEIDNPKEIPEFTLNSDGALEIPPMTAHFTLDGKHSDVVIDEVSGEKGSLVNGDPAVSWIPGAIGGAVHLDGYNDRIFIPYNESIDFGDESFSISFWMRWPKSLPAAGQHILSKGDYESSLPGETGKRWEIYIASGRNLRFNIDDDVEKSQIQVSLKPYITGEWVHVAAVRDTEDKRMKLYANGVLQQPNNPGNPGNDGTHTTGNISNPRGLYIGDASREDALFQGDLDDLCLFRSALTDNQVAGIAARAKLVEKENVIATADPRVVPAKASEIPPMIAHFPLKEGEGTIVTDVINGANGILSNADPAIAWTSSATGLALRFDGVDDGIVVPNNPGYDFSDESFTVSFWMRWPKGVKPNHERIFAKGDYNSSDSTQTGKRWEIYMPADEGLCFVLDDDVTKSQIQAPFDVFTTGEWVHVAALRDTKNKQLLLYADGVPQQSTHPDSAVVDGVDRTGNISNPKPLCIGQSGCLDNWFEGELSEIRIYRSALNASQVAGVAGLKGSAASNPNKTKSKKK